MPSHEEHCQDRLKRYGKAFSELHRWMDEPSEIMGAKHRMYRHDPYATPREARLLFGEYADQACLDHIMLDRKTSEAKRWQIDRPRKQTTMHPIALLFFASLFFVLGLFVVNIKYVGWFFAIWLWAMALLSLLGFLAAIGGTKETEPEGFVYEIEMPPPQYLAPKPENAKKNEETTSSKEESEDQ